MKKQKQKKIRVPREKRINDILLGPLERPALQWFCKHMPAWVTPDLLTGIGVGGAALMTLGYALSNQDKNFLWLVNLGILVNWFGDSLDGTLARVRKIERPRYGFFIDHMTDTFSEVLVFVGLGLSPFLNFNLAMFMLVTYLMASIYIFLTTYVKGVFRLSYSGISPTEMRLIGIATNTVIFISGNPLIHIPRFGFLSAPLVVTVFDLVIFGLILIINYLLVVNVYATATVLSREDRAVIQVKKIKRHKTARVTRRQARSRGSARHLGEQLNQPGNQ